MAQIKISSLPTGTPQGTDLTPATDPLDTSSAATGTTKKFTRSSELNFYLTAQGYRTIAAVKAASTGALTVTYSNGALGVGATLTNAGVQAALTLDGVTLAVSDRVLIKNQASTLQNGIYTVTNIGSASTNWVLTRATDYDQAADIAQFDVVLVNQGTVSAGKAYQETGAGAFVIGTTPILFSLLAMVSVVTPTTDNAIARYNGTTGALQNSLTLIDDTGNIVFPATQGVYDTFGNPLFLFNSTAASNTWMYGFNNAGGSAAGIGAESSTANAGINFRMKGSSAYGFSGSTTKGAEIQWFEQTTVGTNAIAERAPSTITTPYTLVKPATPPSVSGQVKTVTTAGVESWSGIAIAATNGVSFGSGGGTLNYYQGQTAFVIGISYATPGDLSVAYTVQSGLSIRVGDLIYVFGTVAFTPTFTTASGFFQITGLPFAIGGGTTSGICVTDTAITFPAGRTAIGVRGSGSATVLNIVAQGTGVASTLLNATNIVSGVACQIRFAITYSA